MVPNLDLNPGGLVDQDKDLHVLYMYVFRTKQRKLLKNPIFV